MRKLFILLIAVLAIVPAVSAQTCDCENLQSQIDALTARIETLEGKAPAQQAPAASSQPASAEAVQEAPAAAVYGDFEQVAVKDFTLDYLGYEFGKTYDGKDTIQITFHYSNNSDESKAYIWAISTTAFQDGIELKDAYVEDSERSTEIRPGKGIDIIEGFYLRSLTEPIELEFDTPISFNDDQKTTRFLIIQ